MVGDRDRASPRCAPVTSPLPDILQQIRSLEPLPEVAAKVLELSGRSDVVPSELVAVIQTDVAMTAKVLKLTNSAYYGFRREIASIHEAGNLLGVSVLVNLVLTACTGRYFRTASGGDPDSTRRQWERSVENALAASLLARSIGGVDQNRAYTVGLLQNLGLSVLGRFLQERGADMNRAIAGGMSPLAAEALVLGLDHAEVGALLAERWGFPEVLVDTIRFHHEPDHATCDPLLAHIVHLADEVTSALRSESNGAGTSAVLRNGAVALEQLGGLELEALAQELAEELQQAKEFVALV